MRQMPMLTSHNLMVLSLDPDKRKGPGFPLFLLCDRGGETCKKQHLVVKKPMHQSISSKHLWACGFQDGGMSVLRGPGDTLHHMFVLPQLRFALLGGHHPDTHCLVVGAAGDQRAVLVGTHHSDPLPVACERLHTVPGNGTLSAPAAASQMKIKDPSPFLPSGDLPHLHGLVSWGRHYMVAIWHDGYRRNIVVVAWKHKQGLTLQLLGVHLNGTLIHVQ